MTMIKRNVILILLVAAFTTSCSDWLDVAPSNQVNGDEMFSTGDGYRNALNGVYLKLAGSSLYGKEMTWGFMDVLSQNYKANLMKSIYAYRKATEYRYDDDDVKSIISSLWSVGYNDIANCNNLIGNVSKADPSLFTNDEMEKNIIWGEALALRAFIHFDMLRMFAPSMVKDDQKDYIPYVDTYPAIATTYETNSEILKKIEQDLKAAKDLLATCDTIPENKVWMSTECRMLAEGTTTTIPDDVFFAYRGFRMNYYAVTATLARVYCWAGRYEDAYKQAKEVVEATFPDGSSAKKCFDFAKHTELSSNLKDYNSIIMAFSNETLTETYMPYVTENADVLLVFDSEDIFEGSKEDERGDALIGTLKGNKYSLKYTINKGTKGADMIPILRLSEMYYIMGEYYARNSDLKKAGEMLDQIRSARGIISTSLRLNSLEDFQTELLKEVRKEFIGEGQLFFQYKRLDKKPVAKAEFVFSRPDNEDF